MGGPFFCCASPSQMGRLDPGFSPGVRQFPWQTFPLGEARPPEFARRLQQSLRGDLRQLPIRPTFDAEQAPGWFPSETVEAAGRRPWVGLDDWAGTQHPPGGGWGLPADGGPEAGRIAFWSRVLVCFFPGALLVARLLSFED